MKNLGIIEGKVLSVRWDNENNQLWFMLDGEEIALYDMDVMDIMQNPIVYRNNTIENELSAEAKDEIQKYARDINLEEIKKSEERENDEREHFARALDIEKDSIKSITEVNLEQEVEEDEKDSQDRDTNQEENQATTQDINIKQEIKLSSMATSTKTLGSVLQRSGKMPNMEGKNFEKLGVVESDSIKDIDNDAKTNTTRFAFVAIATDGTVVPLDLEQDHQEGNDPREIGYRVNADGRVEQDDVNSRYKIGNNGETISIKTSNGPGNIEIGYSAHKTIGGNEIEGNESIDHQLETDTVYWRPRKESRDQEYADGVYGVEDRAEEARIEAKHNPDYKEGQKEKPREKSDDYKNIDGDKETKDSEHQNDLIERARKLIDENPEVKSVFTEEEVVKMLENAHDNNKDLDEAEEDIIEDASRIPTRENHN